VSQFVIPAKSVSGGHEPGSRKNLIVLNFHWIPDLARSGGLVRNDEFGELSHSFQGERRFSKELSEEAFWGTSQFVKGEALDPSAP